MMKDPEQRLDPALWDPRCDPQAFEALSPQGRFSALHLHVDTVMAAFDAPVDEAGMANMKELADRIKASVEEYNTLSNTEPISAAKLAEAAARWE
jgi:hypothetical protein